MWRRIIKPIDGRRNIAKRQEAHHHIRDQTLHMLHRDIQGLVNRGMVDNRADNTEFLRMVELHILLYILMLARQMSGCPGLLACFRFIISQAQGNERGGVLASFSKNKYFSNISPFYVVC